MEPLQVKRDLQYITENNKLVIFQTKQKSILYKNCRAFFFYLSQKHKESKHSRNVLHWKNSYTQDWYISKTQRSWLTKMPKYEKKKTARKSKQPLVHLFCPGSVLVTLPTAIKAQRTIPICRVLGFKCYFDYISRSCWGRTWPCLQLQRFVPFDFEWSKYPNKMLKSCLDSENQKNIWDDWF